MARRRRRRKEDDEGSDSDTKEEKPTSGSQPKQERQPSGSKGDSGPSGLNWASDPPYISIYDDTTIAAYSIFCPMGASRTRRNTNFDAINGNINTPLVFNEAIMGAQPDLQFTLRDQALVGEIVFNELNRVITTPGDISMENLKQTVTDYLSYVTALVGSWCTTAALYGLAEAFPQATGQLKNYLASLGAKPWQQEAKATALKTIPMPTKLLQFLMSWYAVKQIPDGRSMFAVPSQPVGLTPDEDSGSPRVRHNKDLFAFETQFNQLMLLTDDDGKQCYPELRRMLMTAGWTTYDFPNSLPVVRDGQWWDMQVINAPSAAFKDNSSQKTQINPQAGFERRSYGLSVYSESLSPFLQRMLMPVGITTDPDAYDRSDGSFSFGAMSSTDEVAFGSTGAYNLETSISADGVSIYYARPVVLSLGQVPDHPQIGWSRSIGLSGVPGSSWLTTTQLSALYSEMSSILIADEGSDSLDPLNVYEKIFKGQSTTVSSNRLKFGNTVSPNMTGDLADNADIRGEYLAGKPASMQRLYQFFLTP